MLAKAPVPGRVKTRLCPPATPAQAAGIASAALLDTLDAVLAVPAAHPVVALGSDATQLTVAADGAALSARMRGTRVLPQRGANLGQRIAAAHADTAAVTGAGPVLQIGMDTPQVDAALLSRCLDALTTDGVDAVLGPATDGGWWVLGVREAAMAALIADVPTSRPDTGARTLAALRAGGCRVGELPELSDVDTWQDALAVAAEAPYGRFAAAVAELAELAALPAQSALAALPRSTGGPR